MQPDQAQQLVIENRPAAPAANTGEIINQNSNRKLSGWRIRLMMGIFQISFGLTEFSFGIAVICIPMYYYDTEDMVGWGIWNGVFAIVTGVLGVKSQRKKGMVIAYMVTSIIAAVLSGVCLIWAASMISYASWSGENRAANLASYIILCIAFALQMLMSVIGASFTCRPVCSTNNNQQQIVYYYVAQAPQQQPGPVAPYMQSAIPPPQYSAPYGGPPLPANTSDGHDNAAPSKNPL